jgi:hypothetical protein
MRRLALLLAVVLTPLAFTGTAAAVPPTIEPVDFTVTTVVTDICDFPVEITSTLTGTQMTFTDEAGNVTRILAHITEQDVFTANDKSLTGLPFTFTINFIFEDGEVTHVFASGVAERIVLPDGTLFLSAGRLDFVAHPGSDFRIVPDVGRSGDVAAFCAALADP